MNRNMFTKMTLKKCLTKVESVVVYSPIGQIGIHSCSFGLHRISQLGEKTIPNTAIEVKLKDDNYFGDNQAINDSIEWLKNYFDRNHKMHIISPQLCPFQKYTDFNHKVWSTLMNETKFGQTISYSELALKSIGNVRASRAVGTAMKNNPFQLLVPCHRVIKKDGTNGHYAGGHKNYLKDWLLSFESSSN